MSEPRLRAYGIDVSNNNGMFNWLKWQGHIQFAMIKASEATDFLDPLFPENWDSAKEIGVHRFAYHYARTAEDPATQARRLVEYVESRGLEPQDHFALDLEDTGAGGPDKVSFWAWVFTHTVNRLAPDHRCLVYTYPAFADAGNCAMSKAWPLWISNTGVPAPDVPPPWTPPDGWAFWQYISSPLGQDVFNGTPEQLDDFCASNGPFPP